MPLRSVLARTEELVVALLDAVAYTTGLSFRLTVKRRREPPAAFDAWFRDPLGLHERFSSEDALPDDLLRLGVLFSDGRKATTTGGMSTFGRTEGPSGPVLTPSDSSGGGGEWESTLCSGRSRLLGRLRSSGRVRESKRPGRRSRRSRYWMRVARPSVSGPTTVEVAARRKAP